ncbi:3-hydroxyacyl-CoA dehydrogenase NAD-binding domain-containing protein [Telmatobacter sp. DSM 110680]|uniref:3-hydroxyacyl-CoA dehydrogenase NAD-binding domain-containing protein n=1 Tax=Telmatobacter sp. DSM 110680 TaxID=3036704 RepID=A0AAU7DFZ9_9BACT
MQVAIIGAGPLGRWLAFAAARAGYTVLLEDVMPSNLHHAQEYLRQQLGPAALPMVEFASTIEGAVREADLAIDCVPDELESKLEIFCLLDRMAPPRTVFITPTTRLSIADLASCTYRADKCVALVAKMQELTEASIGVGAGEQSREILLRTPPHVTQETIALVQEFWERIGFTPRFESDRSQ